MTAPARLNRLFTKYSEPKRLSLQEECRLVEAAREGDSNAFSILAETYVPALRAAYNKYRGVLPNEDDRQAAVLRGFTEAIYAVDLDASEEPMRRVAGYLRFQISKAVNSDVEAARCGTLAVPESTARRYYEALRKHGSIEAALQASAGSPQKIKSLSAIHAGLSLGSVDEVLAVDDEEQSSTEANLHPFPYGSGVQTEPPPSRTKQAHQALAVLQDDPMAEHIIREAFGFNDSNGKTDTAPRKYGSAKSRVYERGMEKMRAAAYSFR